MASGGYEEVELKSLWGTVAGALGKKKSHAQQIKQRYEDMLRVSVEQEEQEEDEAQDFEVDQILDKRSHHGQVEQHLGLQKPPRRFFHCVGLGLPLRRHRASLLPARERRYLVKWKGVDADDDMSWEPRRNLAGQPLRSFGRPRS